MEKPLRIEGTKTEPPSVDFPWHWFGPVFAPIIRSVPAYPDTRQGRKRSKLVKAGLVIVGALFALSNAGIWAIASGAVLLISSLFLPLTESQQRRLLAALRKGTSESSSRSKVKIEVDEKSVSIWDSGRTILIPISDADRLSIHSDSIELNADNRTYRLSDSTRSMVESKDNVAVEIQTDEFARLKERLNG